LGGRTAPKQFLPMPKSVLPAHVLLVEPDEAARSVLQTAASAFAHIESHGRFETARARVCHGSFDFLVTNLRLDAYNGLHLVYLRTPGPDSPRAIVYSGKHDLGLAREAQRAGAFYEIHECLPVTLVAYLHRALPDRDRRDPVSRDRRGLFRGGRRCWDHHLTRQIH
jgi:DNA-binding NtrC family response regulator